MRSDGSTDTYEIARRVFERIRSDEFQVGDRLPLGRELAQEFGVDHNIPHRAYQLLGELGFVRSKRGVGTFLVKKPGRNSVLNDPVREVGRRLVDEDQGLNAERDVKRDELLRSLDELEHDMQLRIERLRERIRSL